MSIKLVAKTLTLTTALSLAACGGSGGGGGDDSVRYRGLTTPAAVTDTNAPTLAEGVIGGSSTGTAFGVISEAQEAESGPTLLDLARILTRSVTQLDIDIPPSHLPGAIINDSGSDACADGGSIAYNLSVDDVTFEFSGTFRYRDCAEGDTTINGRAEVSGSIGASIVLDLDFDSLTVVTGAESYTLSGTIDTSASLSTATIAMNVRQRNNNTGLVEWLNNLTLIVEDNFSFVQLTITGRYYHPDHGYVEVVTNTPFQIDSADEWPNVGQMTITGDSGGKARLTAVSNTQYTLEVDAEGDDIYETTTLEDWE